MGLNVFMVIEVLSPLVDSSKTDEAKVDDSGNNVVLMSGSLEIAARH